MQADGGATPRVGQVPTRRRSSRDDDSDATNTTNPHLHQIHDHPEYHNNKFLYKAGAFGVIGLLVLILLVKVAIYECRSYYLEPMSQRGRVIVITGANSGLGLQSSLILAQAGASIAMGCRNVTKGIIAKEAILAHVPDARLNVYELDLASFQSVKKFASEVKKDYRRIDVLMNNAAEMALARREDTKDGNERQMQTNHLSHFLLTSLLLSSMSKEGRIVNVGSAAYILAANDFIDHDFQSSKRYIPFIAYGNTKACNLYFTYELNRRLNVTGSKIKAIVTHPGYTATNLQVNRYPFWSIANALFAMKVEDGALSQIIASVDPDINPSMYNFLGPKYLTFGFPVVEHVGKVKDATLQKLWTESIRLTGAKYSSLKDK